MADIQMRFNRDVLTLSSPAEAALRRMGIDDVRGMGFALLFEPETVEEAYRMEALSGAQCLVAPTAPLTPARLAREGLEDSAADLARAALRVLEPFRPQHVLVELGPCGLPLDPTSKASLNEHRDQYARAARLFEGQPFDAFLLSGFRDCADLKCALMGLAQASGAPVMASATVSANGSMGEGGLAVPLEEAVAMAEELGAAVVGFEADVTPLGAIALAERARGACGLPLPLLAQLQVTEGGACATPDAMADAGTALCAAGVQFLRATGSAGAAFAGALAAATAGLEVPEAGAAERAVIEADLMDAAADEAAAQGEGRR